MKAVLLIIIAAFTALTLFAAVAVANAPPTRPDFKGAVSLDSVSAIEPLSAATTSMADIERMFANHCKVAECKPFSMPWLQLLPIFAPAALLILGYMTGFFDRILSGIERISRNRWIGLLVFSIISFASWQWLGSYLTGWVQDYYQSWPCTVMENGKRMSCEDRPLDTLPRPLSQTVGLFAKIIMAGVVVGITVGFGFIVSRFVWTRWAKWGWLLAIPAIVVTFAVQVNQYEASAKQGTQTNPLPDTAAGEAVRALAKANDFPPDRIVMTTTNFAPFAGHLNAQYRPPWDKSLVQIPHSMFNECDADCGEALKLRPDLKEPPYSQGELLFVVAHEIAHAQLHAHMILLGGRLVLFAAFFWLGWWALHRWDARRNVVSRRKTQLTALLGVGIIAFYGSGYVNNMNKVWQEHRADVRALQMTDDPDGGLTFAVRSMKDSGQLDWPLVANLFFISHPDWRWRIASILAYARDNPPKTLDRTEQTR